ncbi:hypothetical protein GAY28_00205 [Azospirillum brasilense]|nr:hypothetical protein [Azospirillum brasilense]
MPIDYEEFLQNRAREIVTAAGGDASRIEVLHKSKPWSGTSDSMLWLVADAQGRRNLIIPDAAMGPEVVTPDWCRLQARRLKTSAEEIRRVAAEAEVWPNSIMVSGIKVGVATLEDQCARGRRSGAGWEPPDEDPLIWTNDPQRLMAEAELYPELLPGLLKSARRHGREVRYIWGELGEASRMIVVINGAYRSRPSILRVLDRLKPIDENFPEITDGRPDDVSFFDDGQTYDDPTTHWRLASCEVCGDQLALDKERCICSACTLQQDTAGVASLWSGPVDYTGLERVKWRHDEPPQENGVRILIRMPQIDGFRVRPEGPAVRQQEHAIIASRDSDGWRIAEGLYVAGEPEHGWAPYEGGSEHG